MTKAELVELVAMNSNVTQKKAGEVLDALIQVIQFSVAQGEKVQIVGFGAFEPRARSAREVRNPATGEAIDIPATVVPAFCAGKKFKDAVAASASNAA